MATVWTEEEKDKTETLRKRCGDLLAKLGEDYPKHKVDGMLIRFLRARNHDLTKSTEFLRNHLEWRIENLPIDLEDVRDELMKGKYGIAGYDLGGNPCICIHQQKMGPHTYDDIEVVKKVCLFATRCVSFCHISALPSLLLSRPPPPPPPPPPHHPQQSIVFALEWLCDNKVAPDGKFSVVYSRVNCTPENSDVDWVKAVAPLLQNHYPERLYKAYLAPAPWIMRGVWNMVKYFFDPNTRSKIELWADPDGLTEFIDRETLDDAFNADLVDPSILFDQLGAGGDE